MSTAVLNEPTTALPDGYPFHIGYRYVRTGDDAGREEWEKVPLTEEDFLHPLEGDRFMVKLGHTEAIWRLGHAITYGGRAKPAIGLFAELRIDWQVPGIRPHGPDVIVFDRDPTGLASDTGTLFVADLGLKPLVLFEVTSPETRHIDFGDKFDEYLYVGVPVYVVLDLAAPDGEPRVIGFQLAGDRYREMPTDPRLGLYVPALELWFRLEDGWLIVADAAGKDLPDSREMGLSLDAAEAETKAEKQRAEAEKQRAEAEKQRAESEKTRADTAQRQLEAMARELAELKARLASGGQ